jgi:hypothetical protein
MVALNTAYAAPKNAADLKKRVGDFFYEDRGSVGKNRLANRLGTQEKSCYHYETASGRSNWPSRDPFGEVFDRNLFSFVKNRPINLIDVLGLSSFSPGSFGVGPNYYQGGGSTFTYNQGGTETFVNEVNNIGSFIEGEIASQIEGVLMNIAGITNTYAQMLLGEMLNPSKLGGGGISNATCSYWSLISEAPIANSCLKGCNYTAPFTDGDYVFSSCGGYAQVDANESCPSQPTTVVTPTDFF